MIGRGAIADPWIFRRIKHYLAAGTHMPEYTLAQRVELLLENLRMSIALKGDERRATIEMRNIYAGYLRGYPGVAKVRGDLVHLVSYAEVEARLNRFLAEESRQSLAGAA
jgi:tRNA-dihydrouridine synthase